MVVNVAGGAFSLEIEVVVVIVWFVDYRMAFFSVEIEEIAVVACQPRGRGVA